MLKRIIFFFISATILVALYGCHAGGSAPFINTPSESDPWRYTLAKDENQANTRFLRLSQTTQKNPTFKLYRLGIQFALFVQKRK